jgi:hypothetical protein
MKRKQTKIRDLLFLMIEHPQNEEIQRNLKAKLNHQSEFENEFQNEL